MKHDNSHCEKLEKAVRSLLPGSALAVEHFDSYSTVTLPRPAEADFQVAAVGHGDGEPQIAAIIPTARQKHDYFCCLSFEIADYPNEQKRFEDFEARLSMIVCERTRIVQERGCMLWSFSWERYVEGNWICIGGVSCLKGAFPVPEIQGKRRVYMSPPIREDRAPT